MYLSAVSSGCSSLPPTFSRKLSASGSVSIATTPPSANSTIDDSTNGIA